MYHAERMAAIEKGIELSPLPPERSYTTATTPLGITASIGVGGGAVG